MKRKIKGIILLVFVVLLIFWATASSLPSTTPLQKFDSNNDIKKIQLCGHDESNSNKYLIEYKIPSKCTQPLAIADDPYENIWFAQTTDNSISKFNKFKKLFSLYNNILNEKSMIWGIDYSDDSIWYTGDQNNIWQLNILQKEYNKIPYSYENSLLQRIKIINSELIVLNDFTNNKIVVIEPLPISTETEYLTITSPLEDAFTSGFVIDIDKNIWYTNWIFQQHGKLIKLNYSQLKSELQNNNERQINKYMKTYDLPDHVITPNGVSMDNEGNIWITDTSSSVFLKFKPHYINTEGKFVSYITSDPPFSTYGNYSGMIKSPITRPYWNEFNTDKIIFNEQTSNSIAIFNIQEEELIEYLIPTKNSNWADCGPIYDCGINQSFGFTTYDNNIWFTEWVENNIGNINTDIQLPFNVYVNNEIVLQKDEIKHITVTLTSKKNNNMINIINNNIDSNLFIYVKKNKILLDENESVDVELIIKSASQLQEKFLLGGRNNNITISKYITIKTIQ